MREARPSPVGKPVLDAQPKRAPPSRLPQARRDRAAKQKYEQNASGTYSKTRAVCEWDYEEGGALKEFDTVEAFLAHEQACYERRLRGEYPAKYESLSAEQQALASAINACSEEQHEATRADIHAAREELVAGTDEVLRELKALNLTSSTGQGPEIRDGHLLNAFELIYDNMKIEETTPQKGDNRPKWTPPVNIKKNASRTFRPSWQLIRRTP